MRSRSKASDLTATRILRACADGAVRTKIVNQPNPNSVKMISYLMLIDEGLIDVAVEGSRTVHKVTAKGLERIESFERLNADGGSLWQRPGSAVKACPH